jgi:hypothetical protein
MQDYVDVVRKVLRRWPDDFMLRIRILAVIAAYADKSPDCKRLVSLYVPWCIHTLSVSRAPFRSREMILLVNIIEKAAYSGDITAIKALLRFSQDTLFLNNYTGCKRAYYASLRDALLRNEARVIPALLMDREITPEHKDLLFAIKYSGIKWIDRFHCDDLFKIVAQRLAISDGSVEDKPLAVAVYALADKRAFLENKNLFRELLRKWYRVVYFEVGGKNEFVSALVSAARIGQAQVLIVAGHGSPERICLGGRHGRFSGGDQPFISIQDEKFLLEAGIDRALSPGGTVLLISCSTGKGGEKSDNIANMFGRIFASRTPGHIFAPMQDTFLGDVDIHPVKGIVSVSWGLRGSGYDAANAVRRDGGKARDEIFYSGLGLLPAACGSIRPAPAFGGRSSRLRRAWDNWGDGGYSKVPAKEKDFEKVDISYDLIESLIVKMPIIDEYLARNGDYVTSCFARYL